MKTRQRTLASRMVAAVAFLLFWGSLFARALHEMNPSIPDTHYYVTALGIFLYFISRSLWRWRETPEPPGDPTVKRKIRRLIFLKRIAASIQVLTFIVGIFGVFYLFSNVYITLYIDVAAFFICLCSVALFSYVTASYDRLISQKET